MKAVRDFNWGGITYKKGQSLKADEKLLGEWERQGLAVKEEKKKRSTKELKTKVETK